MFSSQWWFMTFLMQELHMRGLGSAAISCRGSPHTQKRMDKFFCHDMDLCWMIVVILMTYSASDVKNWTQKALQGKKGGENISRMRVQRHWWLYDEQKASDVAGIRTEWSHKRVWPSGSEHSADRPVRARVCECVRAGVRARARFSTEAVRSVTDRGETQELSTFHSSSWGDWECAHESTNTVYPHKRRSCLPTNCLSRRQTATAPVEPSGSLAATRRSCHD